MIRSAQVGERELASAEQRERAEVEARAARSRPGRAPLAVRPHGGDRR